MPARISPPPLSAADVRHALLRVWAAAVRDRQPPHQRVAEAATCLAGSLCFVLDLWDARRRRGETLTGSDRTVARLLEALRKQGLVPPA